MTTRAVLCLALLAIVPVSAGAQDAIDPTSCPTTADDASGFEVTHEGRTYYVANAACRDAFIAEPERYAQLFDALAELEAEGRAPAPQADASSLVPS